jgi:hypothetical protein
MEKTREQHYEEKLEKTNKQQQNLTERQGNRRGKRKILC